MNSLNSIPSAQPISDWQLSGLNMLNVAGIIKPIKTKMKKRLSEEDQFNPFAGPSPCIFPVHTWVPSTFLEKEVMDILKECPYSTVSKISKQLKINPDMIAKTVEDMKMDGVIVCLSMRNHRISWNFYDFNEVNPHVYLGKVPKKWNFRTEECQKVFKLIKETQPVTSTYLSIALDIPMDRIQRHIHALNADLRIARKYGFHGGWFAMTDEFREKNLHHIRS